MVDQRGERGREIEEVGVGVVMLCLLVVRLVVLFQRRQQSCASRLRDVDEYVAGIVIFWGKSSGGSTPLV